MPAALLLAILLAGPAVGIASAAPAEAAASDNIWISDISAATACQGRPGDRRYWAWRVVDGRRCWYRGRRGKPKGALFWREAAKPRLPAPAPPRAALADWPPPPPLLPWPEPPPVPTTGPTGPTVVRTVAIHRPVAADPPPPPPASAPPVRNPNPPRPIAPLAWWLTLALARRDRAWQQFVITSRPFSLDIPARFPLY